MTVPFPPREQFHLQKPIEVSRRLQFIDAFRGWAVLVMIETHVLNATLRPEFMQTIPFKVLTFVNGLVAPSFLFASGLAFAVATRRKLPDYLAFRFPLLKHLLRLGLLFVIGYGLHIPKFDYHHLKYDAGPPAWEAFFQVDILHCIGASLLLFTILLLVLRTERRAYLTALILSTGIVLATPLIGSIDFWRLLPVPLAEYLNGKHNSLFPLFPWLSFVVAGGVSGYAFLEASVTTKEQPAGQLRGMVLFSRIAVALIIISLIIEPIAAAMYPVYDYWKTSPSFFMLRLGLVMIACAVAFFYEKKLSISSTSFITISGRESLIVYAVHLMILWGNYKGPHMVDRIGHSFDFAQALALSAGLIALMILLAFLWDGIKRGHQILRRTIQVVIVAGFAYVFFVGL